MSDNPMIVVTRKLALKEGESEATSICWLVRDDGDQIVVTSSFLDGRPYGPKTIQRSEISEIKYLDPADDIPRRMDGGMTEEMVRAGVAVLEKHALTEGFYEQNLRSLAIDLYSRMFLRRPSTEPWPKGKLEDLRARIAAAQDRGENPEEVLGE